jgi:DNA-binding beta-propeller fold protein YncE
MVIGKCTSTTNRLVLASLLLGLLVTSILLAGPPPYPDELKYPNIVPPKVQFGTYGSRLGEFIDPSGVAIDSDDHIYIVDTGNRRIQALDRTGKSLYAWTGSEQAPLIAPVGIAIDASSKSLLVSDVGDHSIKRYSMAGKHLNKWGGFGKADGRFNQPTALAVLGSHVVVADTRNNRLQVFDAAGKHIRSIGHYGNGPGELNQPAGVATDGDKFLFVADSENNRIQKLSLTGEFERAWGHWGSKAGLFATPNSISHFKGELYITDLVNHRMQVFDTDGTYLYQWGRHPAVAHEGNGRVHYPSAIAVSPSGEFTVVTESFENRCQLFLRERTSTVSQVDDSAWWDKATRFHYGSKAYLSENASDVDPCTDCTAMMGISEPDTHSVLLFDIGKDKPRLIARIGGYGRTFGQFIRPTGGAFDLRNGRFYVCDSGNQRIQMFSILKDGKPDNGVQNYAIKFMKAIGTPNAEKSNELTESIPGFPGILDPSVIRRGRNGDFFVLDAGNSRVLVFDSNLRFKRTWGKYGTGDGEFREPLDLSIGKDGDTIYVSDVYNFRVQMFDPQGTFKGSWGKSGPGPGEFITLFGVAAGNDGSVFATDTGRNRVQKFDAQGGFIKEWGRWGSGPGEFYKPKGIAQDRRGRVFVVDFGNHRGQIFDDEGKFLTMFGIGEIDSATPSGTPAESAGGYNTKTTYRLPGTQPEAGSVASQEKLNGLAIESNAGSYQVLVKSSSQTVPLNRPFDLELTVSRLGKEGNDGGKLDVSVDAVMPAHQHGMNRKPVMGRSKDGKIVAKGLVFHMPGAWELHLDISEGYHTERAQVSLNVD